MRNEGEAQNNPIITQSHDQRCVSQSKFLCAVSDNSSETTEPTSLEQNVAFISTTKNLRCCFRSSHITKNSKNYTTMVFYFFTGWPISMKFHQYVEHMSFFQIHVFSLPSIFQYGRQGVAIFSIALYMNANVSDISETTGPISTKLYQHVAC